MNDIINKLLLTGGSFTSEKQLKQPDFTFTTSALHLYHLLKNKNELKILLK